MVRKSELEQRIRSLEEENDALRYKTTDSAREAIWLKLKPMKASYGPGMAADVAWAASAIVREGKISREDMIEFLLGRDESGI
ncbi:hypothetical protein SEA_ROMAN_18 [Microbacterium phage Roman]|nr:hypothetical protein SEA_ROMAN_18 [Microbacterium phage Roman]